MCYIGIINPQRLVPFSLREQTVTKALKQKYVTATLVSVFFGQCKLISNIGILDQLGCRPHKRKPRWEHVGAFPLPLFLCERILTKL